MKVYKAIADVAEALGKVGISKSSRNEAQKYMFRGIDAVYGALSPLLAAHKLCILPRVVERSLLEKETRSGGTLFYTVLKVEFDFVSAEDGSKHTVCTIGEAMDSGDKSSNKAMSAAYKYACFQAFCIPTEGDNDADATTHEVKPTIYADPRGEEWKNADPEKVREAAAMMRDLLYASMHEMTQADLIYRAHLEINKNPDVYVAASKELSAKDRKDWKTFQAMGKHALQEHMAQNGRAA